MARQKNNLIMRSTRGMVGGQIVFKRRAGLGYVAAAPEVNENRKPTDRQLAVQERFKKSTAWAQQAMKNPELKAAYKAAALRNQSSYNVAFQDASYAPVITSLIVEGYTGVINNIIVVHAVDNFKVNNVKVEILTPEGDLVEEGDAIANADGVSWTYTVTKTNADYEDSLIRALATDLPGNTGILEAIR
jgi:hypothetical protein